MARKPKATPPQQAPDDETEEPSSAPRMKLNTPCAWDGDTLVVNILGTPAAKRDATGKTKGHQWKVSVTATPVAGKATDHMVKFLAGEFDVPAKAITVVFGPLQREQAAAHPGAEKDPGRAGQTAGRRSLSLFRAGGAPPGTR